MKKKELFSADCPEAIGPYSEGIQIGNLVFTGQIGTLKSGEMISDSPAEQTQQCLRNIASILKASELELDDVVKCTVYLTNMDYFEEVNEAYRMFFKKPYPARVCIQIAGLPANAKVEIDAIAYSK